MMLSKYDVYTTVQSLLKPNKAHDSSIKQRNTAFNIAQNVHI